MKSEDEDRSLSNQDDRCRYASNFLKTDDKKSGTCGYGRRIKEEDKNARISTDDDKPEQHTLKCQQNKDQIAKFRSQARNLGGKQHLTKRHIGKGNAQNTQTVQNDRTNKDIFA
eukprot:3089696-Heterocapsa_arctica.AAC.1